MNPHPYAIELNHVSAPSNQILEVEESDSGDLNESEKTVKIGKEIGFEISFDDPILVETKGESRENNFIQ